MRIPQILLACLLYQGAGLGLLQAQAPVAPPDSLPACQLCEVVIEDSQESVRTGFYRYQQLGSIEQVMYRNPELSLIRRGNYALEPVLNGMAAGQINVTLDGMRIFGACTDRMDPVTSYAETNNLSKVSVESGSARQGCSLGGCIDLQPQGAAFSDGSLKGQLQGAYQGNSRGRDLSLWLSQGGKTWAWRYAATYRKHDNYSDGNGQEVLYSQYEKMNHALQGRLRLAPGHALSLSLLLDDAWNVGYPALTMDVGSARGRIYGLGYDYAPFLPGRGLQWFKAKVYGNHIIHAMDDSKRPEVPIRMDMPGWSNTYGLFAEGAWRYGRHQLEARADAYRNDLRAEMTMYPNQPGGKEMFMLTWPDAVRAVGGVFVQDTYTLPQGWKLKGNARLEWAHSEVTSDFGRAQFETLNTPITGPDGRKAMALQAEAGRSRQAWQWQAALGYTERLPTVSELYGFYLYNRFDGYDYVGHPDLANERALQASLQGGYRIGKWQLDARLYQYWIRDYILGVVNPELMRMTIGAHGVKVYQNAEAAQLRGASLEWSGQLTPWLRWQGNMQYVYGRLQDGDPLPMMLPLRSLQALRLQHKAWYAQGEVEAAAAQKRSSARFGEAATASFWVMHLRTGYRYKGLQLEAGVENLFDKAYRSHLDWGGILRPGRNIFASVGWKW